MPHISRYPLSRSLEGEVWRLLVEVLAHTGSVEKMEALLTGLLTPTESLMIAKRLAAAILISQGKTDSEIASQLHLTRITTLKLRLLFEKQPTAQVVLKEALTDKKLFQLAADLVENLARYLLAGARGQTPRPRYRRRPEIV